MHRPVSYKWIVVCLLLFSGGCRSLLGPDKLQSRDDDSATTATTAEDIDVAAVDDRGTLPLIRVLEFDESESIVFAHPGVYGHGVDEDLRLTEQLEGQILGSNLFLTLLLSDPVHRAADLLEQESASRASSSEELRLMSKEVVAQAARRIAIKNPVARSVRRVATETKIRAIKVFVQGFNALQNLAQGGSVTVLGVKIAKGKGLQKYFFDAIAKKWIKLENDADNYVQGNVMSRITTGIAAFQPQKAEPAKGLIVLHGLPHAAIVDELLRLGGDAEVQSSGLIKAAGESSGAGKAAPVPDGKATVRMIGINKPFESDYARRAVASGIRDDSGVDWKGGDQHFEVELQGRFDDKRRVVNIRRANSDENLVEWNLYTSPDRRQIKASVLYDASKAGQESYENGEVVGVHCKSGKGRSATVVVGIRLRVVFKQAELKGRNVRWKDVEALISEQIEAVHQARPESSISPAQKNALQGFAREVLKKDYGAASIVY